MSALLLQCCVLSFTASCLGSVLPGKNDFLQKRNSSGTTNLVVADILTNKLKGSPIPDQSGKLGDVEYWLKGMIVSGFACPNDAIIITQTNEGLLLKGHKISVGIQGKWSYYYKMDWFELKDKGTFRLKIRNFSLTLPLTMKIESGKMTLVPGVCDSSVGSVSIKFKGGSGWILNLFKSMIEKDLKKLTEEKVCKVLDGNVNSFISAFYPSG